MRLHGGSVRMPTMAGTAIQWPYTLPRYSWAELTAPFCEISVFIKSSTGSRCSALGAAYQVDVVRGARLLFGRTGQHQLVAPRGDELDRDLDLLLLAHSRQSLTSMSLAPG